MTERRPELKRKLFTAVNTDDYRGVQDCLEEGADANATDHTGRTALFTAVKRGKAKVVEALVGHGANVNKIDEWGRTALFSALEIGNDHVLQILLEHEAELDIGNDERESPLFTAVKVDNVHYIEELLKRGADVTAVNKNGETALFKARSAEAMRVLCSRGLEVNAKDAMGRTALFHVSRYRRGMIVPLSKVLMELGGKPDIVDNFGMMAMFYATRECFCKGEEDQASPELLELFLQQQQPDLLFTQNLKDSQLISLINDDKSKLRFSTFVRDGFLDPQQKGNVITFDAEANSKLLDNCGLILRQGASAKAFDERGSSSLFSAVDRLARGDSVRNVIELCKLLISYGADVSARNAACDSVLLHAIRHSGPSSIELFGFLIDVCDITTRTPKGESSLHVLLDSYKNRFSEYECKPLVPELIDLLSSDRRYETVKSRDNQGNSTLHIWANKKFAHVSADKHESVAKDIGCQIISGGAVVNATNDRMETPLHVAASWMSAELLLSNNALPNARDVDGRSPLLSWAASGISETWSWGAILETGMDPWMADHEGCTLLEVLLERRKFKQACDLIKAVKENKQENVNREHSTGDTLLHIACRCEAEEVQEVIEFLLECGADSRRQNSCKETPLHIACEKVAQTKKSGSVEAAVVSVHFWAITHLLKHGASPSVLNAKGKSCEDIAQNIPQLEDLLKKEIDLLETPPLLPRSPKSERHNTKLEQVRRRQSSRKEGPYHYHEDPIGLGAFSHVFAGINGRDGREVAIKRILREHLFRPDHDGQNRRERQLEFRREIDNLVTLTDCDHVVKYHSWFEDEDFVYIIFELSEGNLEEYMATATWDEKNVSLLCKDVVRGLDFLHKKEIIHRDIKPENILFKTSSSRQFLKIADFGLSKNLSSSTASTVMHPNAGTRCWMAPELIRATHEPAHSKRSDVFACGLVLHYILSCMKHPFEPVDHSGKGPQEIQIKTQDNILEGKCAIDKDLQKEAQHLVELMIKDDKIQRPETPQVLNHPFFWSDEKKVRFLCSVGSQPEFSTPRRYHSPVQDDLEATLGSTFSSCSWDKKIPEVCDETKKFLPYQTSSAVALVRFVRNCYAHASDGDRSPLAEIKLLEDFFFFKMFPTLLMDVYAAIRNENWHQDRLGVKSCIEEQSEILPEQ